MLSSYYGITYDDYSNLYKFVAVCSVLIAAPLFYLIFIRDYLRIGIGFFFNNKYSMVLISSIKNV